MEKTYTKTEVKQMLNKLVDYIAQSQSMVEILAYIDKVASSLEGGDDGC